MFRRFRFLTTTTTTALTFAIRLRRGRVQKYMYIYVCIYIRSVRSNSTIHGPDGVGVFDADEQQFLSNGRWSRTPENC